MAGQWSQDPDVWDMHDPPPVGNDEDTDLCGTGYMAAHHCYVTAIHAVHVHTRQLLVYHGHPAHDERLIAVDGDPAQVGNVVWTPLPLGSANNGRPDTFCSGHVQLADGSVFIAGGNIDSTASGGGLQQTLRYVPPWNPFDLQCPAPWDLEPAGSGWETLSAEMTHDRWYPTLTVLGTGEVLIAGGATNVGANQNSRLVELYDPAMNTMTSLPEFPAQINPVPLYPFMFVLPSGDVLFAGGETADNPLATPGWVLVAPENNEGQWAWATNGIASEVTGASAVMYEPGKILKSGGRALEQNEYGANPGDPKDEAPDPGALRTHRAEKIDLSEVPGGVDSYAGLSFEAADSMNHGRHFHNLVLLPNGTVLAVGGNYAGNSNPFNPGESWQNPCTVGTQEVLAQDCMQGCPSTCIADQGALPNHLRCDNQSEADTVGRCAFVSAIACCAGRSSQGSCEGVDGCVWDGVAEVCEEQGAAPDRCDEAMMGATCSSGWCDKLCSDASECPDIQPVDIGAGTQQCLLEATGSFPGNCSPANNECFKTRSAEIWDPTCDVWEELGEEDKPRMYHSTALLLPNAEVISMGGGHRTGLTDYPRSQFFRPQYAPGGDTNPPSLAIQDGQTTPDGEHFLPWFDPDEPDGRGSITVHTDGSVSVDRFNLVRLGSTTHGFDQDQRFIALAAKGEGISQADDMIWRVFAPEATVASQDVRSIAPPGYYMLFAISSEGTPSEAEYVLLGDDPTVSYLCEADGLVLEPTWTTCGDEPLNGTCATGDQVPLTALLPTTLDAMGLAIEGWRVFMPRTTPGSIGESEAVEVACQQICQTHFGAEPYMTAACHASGAFTTSLVEQGAYGTLDVLLPSHEFGGNGVGTVSCGLRSDCSSEFDERLQGTVPQRISPAAEGLRQGEEYRVSLTGSEVLVSCGAESSLLIDLDGEAGFSHCDPDASVCPFYLGSMDASASPSASLALACDDGSTDNVTLNTLALRLTQPAYGVRDGDLIQFGPGGLVTETEVQIDGQTHRLRRHNAMPITMQGSRDEVDPHRFAMEFSIPCNSSTAKMRLQVDIDKATTLEQPPTASVNLPSSVSCGTAVSLDGTFGDPDGDLDEVLWFVDGVPLDPSLQSVTISQAHEISAAARDQRGAVTTARSTITCYAT